MRFQETWESPGRAGRRRPVTQLARGLKYDARSLASLLFVVALGVASAGCGETSLLASISLDSTSPVPDGTGGNMGLGGGGSVDPPPTKVPRPTLRVIGQRIIGRCDETVVLRGVNEMVIWSDEVDGQPWFDEMAALGANAVRIVWLPEGTPEELDRVVGNAVGAGLIAVIEQHQPYFDGAELAIDDPQAQERTVQYWTSPEIVDVLVKYEAASILEFGEKMGDLDSVDAWVSRFLDMIPRLRAAGIRAPLAVDAPYGGADVDTFAQGAFQVLEADPLDNSIWTVEAWGGPTEGRIERIRGIHELGIPFYLSEFSGYAAGDDCPSLATDVPLLLQTLQDLGLGWFAWSWGGVPNSGCGGAGALDMTTDGHITGLVDWGLAVAQTDENSIAKTSIKLTSLTATACPE